MLKSIGTSGQVIGLKDMPPLGSYFVFSNVSNLSQLENFILSKKNHNNTWDFRGLDNNFDDTAFYINPKSIGIDTIFAEANLITRWSSDNYQPIFKINSTGQYHLGEYYYPFAERNEKSVRLIKFPLGFGTTYSDSIVKRYDYLVIEKDSGRFDTSCMFILGRTENQVISDGIMITNTDTFNCILLKMYTTGTRYHQYKEYGKDWVTTYTEIPDQSVGYFLYSNFIEPVARIYPTTNSDTGVFSLQYLRKNSLKTSIKNIEPNENVIIYPNPATNLLNITLPIESAYTFSIIDLMGKNIQSGQIGQSKNTIDIVELNTGMYYLSITDKDRTSIHKFIKKN